MDRPSRAASRMEPLSLPITQAVRGMVSRKEPTMLAIKWSRTRISISPSMEERVFISRAVSAQNPGCGSMWFMAVLLSVS